MKRESEGAETRGRAAEALKACAERETLQARITQMEANQHRERSQHEVRRSNQSWAELGFEVTEGIPRKRRNKVTAAAVAMEDGTVWNFPEH